MRRVRVLIADHLPTRVGIRIALDGQVSICAEAGNTEQAVRAAMREQPDICLVGRHLPGDALAAIRGICRAAPRAAVVLLTEKPDVDDLLDAVRAGAIGYVPVGLDAAGLMKIISAVASGEAVVPPVMVRDLLIELQGNGAGARTLTGRETQVLGMLRRGHTTAAIAERLQITPVTVRRHVSELVRKLGVRDRSELMAVV